MRTISWKHPLIALFIGGAVVAACSDDTTAPPPAEAGSDCGNGKVDDGEDCDPEASKQDSCSMATMGSKPTGTVKCTDKCKYDVSGCHANGGAGGGGGMGGGTGGVVGTGGMGKGGTAGKGGTTSKDAGSDATDATTPPPDGSKPDSGSGGSAPTDSGKG
jgi:hypothetical protein